jgi:hypothetical protein
MVALPEGKIVRHRSRYTPFQSSQTDNEPLSLYNSKEYVRYKGTANPGQQIHIKDPFRKVTSRISVILQKKKSCSVANLTKYKVLDAVE